VETKQFVSSFVHVILTRQTYGQRLSKAAESKRRALENYLSERIFYMFLVSKCRGDSDLGLCTTSGLACGEPQRNDKIIFFLCRNTFFPQKSPLHLGSPNASPEVVHRPRSYAGRTTKFAPVKSLWFSNSLSEFFFPNSVLLCSFLWAVEWIHEFPHFRFFKPRKEKPPKRPGAVSWALQVSV